MDQDPEAALTSSPMSSSSITTSSPAAPKARSTITSLSPCSASALLSGSSTPLPAASPEALITTWKSACSMKARALS